MLQTALTAPSLTRYREAMPTMSPASCRRDSPFAEDYFEARARFRQLVAERQAALDIVPVTARGPQGEKLTFEAARFGPAKARRLLVLSSGLHGAEAFFGSAVQLHWLARSPLLHRLPNCVGVLLLHALNPYGFAWVRRANEENVDLNRNFLLPGEDYTGSPPLYEEIYRAFNPTARPTRHIPPLFFRSLFTVWRHGMHELRHNLPVGQFEYPQGLFFGGKGPSETQDLLRERMPEWIGDAQEILHFDFHTGLGPWSSQKLLLDQLQPREVDWWAAHFGREQIEVSDLAVTSYPTRGSFGPWLKHLFAGRNYHYTAAEYGTYPPLRVMTALLTEVRAYNHGLSNPRHAWTRDLLRETFAPASPVWRRRVVSQAFAVVEQGLSLLRKHEETLIRPDELS